MILEGAGLLGRGRWFQDNLSMKASDSLQCDGLGKLLQNQRYILIEVKGRLSTVKWKKYNTSLPQKETSC
jgi:hypothetical protein